MLFSSLSILETFNCTSVQFKNIEPPVQVCAFTLHGVCAKLWGCIRAKVSSSTHAHHTRTKPKLETRSLLPVCLPVKVVFI